MTDYHALAYGGPYPSVPDGADLTLLDFSVPTDMLDELSGKHRMVVIDHHKSAEPDLRAAAAAGKITLLFDANKSGAVLAWEYAHPPFRPIPRLLEYVQDRDLWKWNLVGSREVSAWLASWEQDFGRWDELAEFLEQKPFAVESAGAAILRAQRQRVDLACKAASIRSWRVVVGEDVGTGDIPELNATADIGEIGERLCELYPDAAFSATYQFRTGPEHEITRVWSLRSRGEFDVSVIAKSLGGGGHKNAAGFSEAGFRLTFRGCA